ncbi:hypothetical protein PF001_g32291, partial [Phytophthora fragariae]
LRSLLNRTAEARRPPLPTTHSSDMVRLAHSAVY